LLHARWFVLSLVLACAAFAPASAQARALLLFGQGGRMFPLINLSEDGDDMAPGGSYGGGIGLQLGPNSAIRAMVNISNSRYRGQTATLSDAEFTRSYYGLDLMFGAPSDAGLAPYFFVGGGRVSSDPAEFGAETISKLAGRLGTGVNYVPDNSFFVLFVEACGWIYEYELLGFKKLQINSAILGGLAFAVPF
jgi:hypothetical protein